MTPTETPRIWANQIMTRSDDQLGFSWESTREQIELVRDRDYYRPISAEDAPIRLAAKPHRKLPKKMPDIFKAVGRLLIVSEKTHDVLRRFDLGRTGLFEVPIHANGLDAPPLEARYWYLHVAEQKDGFLPEQSEGVVCLKEGAWWRSDYHQDTLAVKASVAEGVDLWADRRFRDRLFATDALKQDLDAAGVVTRDFVWKECRVFPDAV